MIFTDYRDKLPKGDREYSDRLITDIHHVLLHHEGANNGLDSAAGYHTRPKPGGRGWPGLAYHYWIDRRGWVYLCNPIWKKTYHAGYRSDDPDVPYYDWNKHSIGICIQGNFEKEEFWSDQKSAVIDVCCSLKVAIPDFDLGGHRDNGKATACPGKHVYEQIPNIEAEIALALTK